MLLPNASFLVARASFTQSDTAPYHFANGPEWNAHYFYNKGVPFREYIKAKYKHPHASRRHTAKCHHQPPLVLPPDRAGDGDFM